MPHISKTRTVGYTFSGAFNESAMETLLRRAQLDGVVTQYDTGRGRLVWFNGPPGAALRALKARVKSMISEEK
jgi:hypothetical protein